MTFSGKRSIRQVTREFSISFLSYTTRAIKIKFHSSISIIVTPITKVITNESGFFNASNEDFKKMRKSRQSILVRHQLFLEIAFGPLSLNAPGFRGYIYITSRFRHLSPGNITLIRSHEIARGRRDSIEVAERASETGNELRGALSCNRVRFYRSATTR